MSGLVFVSWSNTSNSACCFGDALRCVPFSWSKHGVSQSALVENYQITGPATTDVYAIIILFMKIVWILTFPVLMKSLMVLFKQMWSSPTPEIASMFHQESLKVHARLTLHGFRLMIKNVNWNLAVGRIVVGRYKLKQRS